MWIKVWEKSYILDITFLCVIKVWLCSTTEKWLFAFTQGGSKVQLLLPVLQVVDDGQQSDLQCKPTRFSFSIPNCVGYHAWLKCAETISHSTCQKKRVCLCNEIEINSWICHFHPFLCCHLLVKLFQYILQRKTHFAQQTKSIPRYTPVKLSYLKE